MFEHAEVFSSFSTDDIAKTKAFYGDTLGLDVNEEAMGTLTIDLASGGSVVIYPKEDHEPATFTVLNFPVDDIDDTVDKLTALGVTFEHYEGDIQTDDKGVLRSTTWNNGPNIAWFKDPSGNILSILQPV